jgi:hypothetical protein
MITFSGEKFELKLIKLNDVLLHEECEDNRYEKLMQRFIDDGVLYNPLIVGKHNDSYILIDGANRYKALKALGAKLILAQIVNYKSKNVVLKSWYHFVNGMELADVRDFIYGEDIEIRKFKGSSLKKLNLLGITGTTGRSLLIKLKSRLEAILDFLCRFSKYYENRFNYTRVDSQIPLRNIRDFFKTQGLLIIYPAFRKEHIVKIAKMSQKLPAGVSRHLIPNRVLKIKYDIENLMSDKRIADKNSELMELIEYKIQNKKVRLYREPVFIFDE